MRGTFLVLTLLSLTVVLSSCDKTKSTEPPEDKEKASVEPPQTSESEPAKEVPAEVSALKGVRFGDSLETVTQTLGEPKIQKDSKDGSKTNIAYKMNFLESPSEIGVQFTFIEGELEVVVAKPKLDLEECRQWQQSAESKLGPAQRLLNQTDYVLYKHDTFAETENTGELEYVYAWEANGGLIKLTCSPGGVFMAMQASDREDTVGMEVDEFVSMEQVKKVYEPFQSGDLTYDINRILGTKKVGKGPAAETATDGARFVLVEYTITNEGNATKTRFTSSVKLVDEKGRTFSPSSRAMTAVSMSRDDVDFALSQLQPGIPRKQVAAFETPKDIWRFKLKFGNAPALPVYYRGEGWDPDE